MLWFYWEVQTTSSVREGGHISSCCGPQVMPKESFPRWESPYIFGQSFVKEVVSQVYLRGLEQWVWCRLWQEHVQSIRQQVFLQGKGKVPPKQQELKHVHPTETQLKQFRESSQKSKLTMLYTKVYSRKHKIPYTTMVLLSEDRCTR